MTNEITAYFKGRIGVAESVYQYDYGIVMAFDSIDLPAHFDCYFSILNQEEAIPGVGADRMVAIPNSVLANPGAVTIHIPIHTGANDSEVEYIVYFKVIGRARPIDDGTPVQMTAIEQALALLQNPIGNIEQIVNEALSFTGDTFEEMQEKLDADQAEFEDEMGERADAFEAEIREDISDVESDFANLNAQFQTAVSAVTTDTEVTNIRVGADGTTYTTAGEAVRKQFTDLKDEIDVLENVENVTGSVTNGKFINTGGGEASNSDYQVTDYIPVKKGDVIIYHGVYGTNSTGQPTNVALAFYDSSKAYQKNLLSISQSGASRWFIYKCVTIENDGYIRAESAYNNSASSSYPKAPVYVGKIAKTENTISFDTLDAMLSDTTIDSDYYIAEYIEATGQQYINTGISFKPTTGIEVDYEISNPIIADYDKYGAVFGSRIGSQSSELTLNTWHATASGLFRYGTNQDSAGEIVLNTRRKFSWVNGNLTICEPKGDYYRNVEGLTTNITADNQVPIALFGINSSGTVSGLAKMKLYSAKIYDGSTVVANFVPVQTKDGVFGLYDTVSETFFDDENGTETGFVGKLRYTASVESRFNDLEKGDIVTYSVKQDDMETGYVIQSNGVKYANANYLYVENVPVLPSQKMLMTARFGGWINNSGGISGYDIHGNFIKRVFDGEINGNPDDSRTQYINKEIIVPDDVYYIAFSTRYDGVPDASLTIYGMGQLDLVDATIAKHNAQGVKTGTVFDEEVQDSIEAVQTVLASSNKPMLTMAVFTDLHHDPKYGSNDPTIDMMANIKAIYDRVHFDALMNLGDAIDGQFQTQYEAEGCISDVVTAMYDITDRSHSLMGNHDDNVQSTWDGRGGKPSSERLTLLEINDALFKGSYNQVHNPNHLTDYYIDFDEYDIRVICLGIDYTTYNSNTQTWLANVALQTDKKVLVYSHCATKAKWGYMNDIAHGEYVETPLNDFVEGGGTVIAYIHGHTHGDMIETDSDISFTEVAIGCAKFETLTSGTEGITYQDRDADDYTKILFDIVCVDQTNREVHFIRCGAGVDRYISY